MSSRVAVMRTLTSFLKHFITTDVSASGMVLIPVYALLTGCYSHIAEHDYPMTVWDTELCHNRCSYETFIEVME